MSLGISVADIIKDTLDKLTPASLKAEVNILPDSLTTNSDTD